MANGATSSKRSAPLPVGHAPALPVKSIAQLAETLAFRHAPPDPAFRPVNWLSVSVPRGGVPAAQERDGPPRAAPLAH
jgi:hypothetical protein